MKYRYLLLLLQSRSQLWFAEEKILLRRSGPLSLHGAGRKGRHSDSTEEWFVLGIISPEVCEVMDSRLDPMVRGLWSVCKSEGCVKGSLRLHISMASEGTCLQ